MVTESLREFILQYTTVYTRCAKTSFVVVSTCLSGRQYCNLWKRQLGFGTFFVSAHMQWRISGEGIWRCPPLTSHTLIFPEKSMGPVHERLVWGYLLFQNASEHSIFIQKNWKISGKGHIPRPTLSKGETRPTLTPPRRLQPFGAQTLAPLPKS